MAESHPYCLYDIMKNYGFIRAAASVPSVRIADPNYNTAEICRLAGEASDMEASLVAFPELSLTGYTCGDLFTMSPLADAAEEGVRKIVEFSRGKTITIVVGAPVPYRSRLYDCAVVIRNGNVCGIVPKVCLSSAESRFFASGSDFLSQDVRNDGTLLRNGKDFVREGFCGEIRYAGQRCNISPNLLFGIGEYTFAVEVGDDLRAPVPPSSFHALQGAQIIVNISADKETLSRNKDRKALLGRHSSSSVCGYVYASAGFGESTQDNVFAGSASIWENGECLAENERYSMTPSLIVADIDAEYIEVTRRRTPYFRNVSPAGTDTSSYYRLYSRTNLGAPSETDFEKDLLRYVEPHPFAPEKDMDRVCREAVSIQVTALCGRLSRIGSKAVMGISGGLDSTLALIVAALAFDRLNETCSDGKWSRSNIIGVTMPGFGTTSRTKNNAWDLMEALGITSREVPIGKAVEQHFMDIDHNPSVHDATYENSQARERTQILMDIANQTGGIVVGTGDLSELALGWATYNGDHMSMYGVNAGIPKTLVRSLVKWAAENCFDDSEKNGRSVRDILLDISDTPISPELLPANDKDEIRQVTEDLVGPYELHDFFLWNFMKNGFAPEKILFLARKAFCHYNEETILKWLKTFIRRFFNQQFKRSCMPDGPQVTEVTLSPRGGWAMPSDAWSDTFSNKL